MKKGLIGTLLTGLLVVFVFMFYGLYSFSSEFFFASDLYYQEYSYKFVSQIEKIESELSKINNNNKVLRHFKTKGFNPTFGLQAEKNIFLQAENFMNRAVQTSYKKRFAERTVEELTEARNLLNRVSLSIKNKREEQQQILFNLKFNEKHIRFLQKEIKRNPARSGYLKKAIVKYYEQLKQVDFLEVISNPQLINAPFLTKIYFQVKNY